MGNLVFQATLGGQVNLVGPNTASTYNLNVPAVAGTLVTTGDTGTVTNTMCATSVYTAPGTIGSGTPNSGAFTTLSASSTVSGTGFSTYLASPPAIGGTAPAAVTGSNLMSSGGMWAKSTYSGTTYSDGVVIDYTTGLGRISVGTSDGFAFYNAGVATTELMRLDSSGNLGIGTSSPGDKLQVIGSIRLTNTGTLYSYQYSAGNTQTWMVNNATSGDIYLTADTAQRYRQLTALGHIWESAASGSVGGAVTWSEKMRLDSSGNLLVGTTSAWASAARVLVSGASSDATMGIKVGTNGNYGIYFSNQSSTLAGGIVVNSGSVAYNTSSDYRLKENVQPMRGALSKVAALKPVTYTWKADGSDGQGFIAHELQAVVPDCVTGEKDAVDADGNPIYQGIDTSFLVATLTAAIQEQQALITQLQADVAALKAPQ